MLATSAVRSSRRIRFLAWVLSVSFLVVGTPVWLFLLRGPRILLSHNLLVGGWAGLGAIVVLIAILLKTTPADAIRIRSTVSRWIIVGVALLLQALAILLLVPALSDDVLRYRLDGKMWLTGDSPFATTPADYMRMPPAPRGPDPEHDRLDRLVPFSEMHTIYPPTAQAFFVVTRALEDLAVPPDDSAGPVQQWRSVAASLPRVRQAAVQRVALAIVAIGCVITVISILSLRKLSPWYAALLGWNPLFVIETGGMGHVDVVGVLFVLLMIRAMQSHGSILAAAMLALAAGVKPPVLLLAPYLFRDARVRGSGSALGLLPVVSVLFLALLYSPLLIQEGYKGWLATARIYSAGWEANGSIYQLIRTTADQTDGWSVQQAKDRARALAALAVAGTMLLAWWRRSDLVEAGYWITLVALLCAPVVYPWYLLWVLCFVPLLRGWQGITSLIWSATIGVSYLLWQTDDWVLPTKWLLVQYVPVYAALAMEVGRLLMPRVQHDPGQRPSARGSQAS
jgi:alpha-1,6-mannosyltransferase